MRKMTKVTIVVACYEPVVVIFKDNTYSTGWLVPDQNYEDEYCILPFDPDQDITVLNVSNIRYLAYTNGACIFRGYGKYLIPIFMNESPVQVLNRINKTIEKLKKERNNAG